MKTEDLSSLDDFPTAVAKVRSQYGKHSVTVDTGKTFEVVNEILFRGQDDSGLSLSTTLERQVGPNISFIDYLDRATEVASEIESVTGKRWHVSTMNKIKKSVEFIAREKRLFYTLPCYDYLVYLRHHGFPSPLLDWTRSPYIALFFAFQCKPKAERVAIFAFIERPQGGKSHNGNEPSIAVMGPYVTTHPRHFAQRARYTVASGPSTREYDRLFTSFPTSTVDGQDVLIKITLPASERARALEQLDADYNINAYTLFGSEDSFIQTLGQRRFVTGVR